MGGDEEATAAAPARRPSFDLLAKEGTMAPATVWAAFVLAACAGCTNACAMLGVFHAPGLKATGVTHVTGSMTKLGMILAQSDTHSAPALAVLGYVVGSACAGAFLPSGLASVRLAPPCGALLIATAVLLVGAAALQEVDHGHGFGFVPLFCAALASGAQNGMATSVSASLVRTTHMTGCATDIGLIVGRGLSRRLLRAGTAPRDTVGGIFTHAEGNRLGLYIRLATGFVGGAAAGTALVENLDLKYARALYVPAAVLFALGALAIGSGPTARGDRPLRTADLARLEPGSDS